MPDHLPLSLDAAELLARIAQAVPPLPDRGRPQAPDWPASALLSARSNPQARLTRLPPSDPAPLEAAALLDREGLVSVGTRLVAGGRYRLFQLCVQVTNPNPSLLTRCRRATGLGTVEVIRATRAGTEVWAWRARNGEARRLLEILDPYLVHKKPQARVARIYPLGPRRLLHASLGIGVRVWCRRILRILSAEVCGDRLTVCHLTHPAVRGPIAVLAVDQVSVVVGIDPLGRAWAIDRDTGALHPLSQAEISQ